MSLAMCIKKKTGRKENKYPKKKSTKGKLLKKFLKREIN
jgi:hypothetical protein